MGKQIASLLYKNWVVVLLVIICFVLWGQNLSLQNREKKSQKLFEYQTRQLDALKIKYTEANEYATNSIQGLAKIDKSEEFLYSFPEFGLYSLQLKNTKILSTPFYFNSSTIQKKLIILSTGTLTTWTLLFANHLPILSITPNQTLYNFPIFENKEKNTPTWISDKMEHWKTNGVTRTNTPIPFHVFVMNLYPENPSLTKPNALVAEAIVPNTYEPKTKFISYQVNIENKTQAEIATMRQDMLRFLASISLIKPTI